MNHTHTQKKKKSVRRKFQKSQRQIDKHILGESYNKLSDIKEPLQYGLIWMHHAKWKKPGSADMIYSVGVTVWFHLWDSLEKGKL